MNAFETSNAFILQDQWSNVVNPVFFIEIQMNHLNCSILCSSNSLTSFNRPHSSQPQYDKWTIFKINSTFCRYSKMLTTFYHAETTCHRVLQHFFLCKIYMIYSVFSYAEPSDCGRWAYKPTGPPITKQTGKYRGTFNSINFSLRKWKKNERLWQNCRCDMYNKMTSEISERYSAIKWRKKIQSSRERKITATDMLRAKGKTITKFNAFELNMKLTYSISCSQSYVAKANGKPVANTLRKSFDCNRGVSLVGVLYLKYYIMPKCGAFNASSKTEK